MQPLETRPILLQVDTHSQIQQNKWIYSIIQQCQCNGNVYSIVFCSEQSGQIFLLLLEIKFRQSLQIGKGFQSWRLMRLWFDYKSTHNLARVSPLFPQNVCLHVYSSLVISLVMTHRDFYWLQLLSQNADAFWCEKMKTDSDCGNWNKVGCKLCSKKEDIFQEVNFHNSFIPSAETAFSALYYLE